MQGVVWCNKLTIVPECGDDIHDSAEREEAVRAFLELRWARRRLGISRVAGHLRHGSSGGQVVNYLPASLRPSTAYGMWY